MGGRAAQVVAGATADAEALAALEHRMEATGGMGRMDGTALMDRRGRADSLPLPTIPKSSPF